jgi:hypothetical protein
MATARKLEERVTELEAKVAKLEGLLSEQKEATKPDWRKIVGTFADDPLYEEAMKLGRQYRESLRPKPRSKSKQKAKRQRTHGDS